MDGRRLESVNTSTEQSTEQVVAQSANNELEQLIQPNDKEQGEIMMGELGKMLPHVIAHEEETQLIQETRLFDANEPEDQETSIKETESEHTNKKQIPEEEIPLIQQQQLIDDSKFQSAQSLTSIALDNSLAQKAGQETADAKTLQDETKHTLELAKQEIEALLTRQQHPDVIFEPDDAKSNRMLITHDQKTIAVNAGNKHADIVNSKINYEGRVFKYAKGFDMDPNDTEPRFIILTDEDYDLYDLFSLGKLSPQHPKYETIKRNLFSVPKSIKNYLLVKLNNLEVETQQEGKAVKQKQEEKENEHKQSRPKIRTGRNKLSCLPCMK